MQHGLKHMFLSQGGPESMFPDSYGACWAEQNNFSHLQVSAYTHRKPLHHVQSLVEQQSTSASWRLESEKMRLETDLTSAGGAESC